MSIAFTPLTRHADLLERGAVEIINELSYADVTSAYRRGVFPFERVVMTLRRLIAEVLFNGVEPTCSGDIKVCIVAVPRWLGVMEIKA